MLEGRRVYLGLSRGCARTHARTYTSSFASSTYIPTPATCPRHLCTPTLHQPTHMHVAVYNGHKQRFPLNSLNVNSVINLFPTYPWEQNLRLSQCNRYTRTLFFFSTGVGQNSLVQPSSTMFLQFNRHLFYPFLSVLVHISKAFNIYRASNYNTYQSDPLELDNTSQK